MIPPETIKWIVIILIALVVLVAIWTAVGIHNGRKANSGYSNAGEIPNPQAHELPERPDPSPPNGKDHNYGSYDDEAYRRLQR